VAETAYRLARALGWPPPERERALRAALLHDLAKELPPQAQVELARSFRPDAGAGDDPVEDTVLAAELGPLLHARAAAALAGCEYGIEDPDVLEAIAWHPTGTSRPAPLTQLLVAADYLEPVRGHLDAEDRRLLADALDGRATLAELFCRVLERKLDQVRARGRAAHPQSLAAWEAHCGGRG
jgi:HD superfamily phosphohydrolase YqeK